MISFVLGMLSMVMLTGVFTALCHIIHVDISADRIADVFPESLAFVPAGICFEAAFYSDECRTGCLLAAAIIGAMAGCLVLLAVVEAHNKKASEESRNKRLQH